MTWSRLILKDKAPSFVVESIMELHSKPIMPKGFKCASKNCGIKPEGRDLSIFYSEVPAIAAGVFTKSLIPGAAVILGREIIKNRCLQAIVVNSGISNVGTDQRGVQNARRMALAASKELGIPERQVIMSSTGVIAKQLAIELIEREIQGIFKELQDDPIEGAKGIITTDTRLKVFSISDEEAIITLIGKGSGMVEPNMGTVLVYVFTDARIEARALDDLLRDAVNYSLNMLSIDTDTSTSDTCIAMANGVAGRVNKSPAACRGDECMPYRGGYKGERSVPLIRLGPCVQL
jgi:glutamate N-acetyltransferase/amino-acid N-acetyltransferase